MRPLPLCTGEQPLVPPSCGFLFSRSNLTTRNAIEVATRTSFLTITHCTVSKVFLFWRHLSWDKEETQIGKVKEERETPDRCYINSGKMNYSITLLPHLRDVSNSPVLSVGRGVTSLPPYRNRRPRRWILEHHILFALSFFSTSKTEAQGRIR